MYKVYVKTIDLLISWHNMIHGSVQHGRQEGHWVRAGGRVLHFQSPHGHVACEWHLDLFSHQRRTVGADWFLFLVLCNFFWMMWVVGVWPSHWSWSQVRTLQGPMFRRHSWHFQKKNPCLKGCKPHFDDDKLPTKFHNTVSAARTCCHDLTFASLEHVVRNCAVDGEQTQRDRVQNFNKAWVCHHWGCDVALLKLLTHTVAELWLRKRRRLEI